MAPLLRCDWFVMHIPADMLFNHSNMDKCNKVKERRIRKIDVDMEARCGEIDFSLYG